VTVAHLTPSDKQLLPDSPTEDTPNDENMTQKKKVLTTWTIWPQDSAMTISATTCGKLKHQEVLRRWLTLWDAPDDYL